MTIAKALITLDLNDVTETQRDKFYEQLEKKEWNKLTDLTTTWEKNKKINKDNEQNYEFGKIEDECRNDIKFAKKASGVKSVDMAIHVGLRQIVEDHI